MRSQQHCVASTKHYLFDTTCTTMSTASTSVTTSIDPNYYVMTNKCIYFLSTATQNATLNKHVPKKRQ